MTCCLFKVNNAPRRSIRQFENEMQTPRMRIWRTLNSNNYRPYKIHLSQKLRPGDDIRRLEFSHWLLNKINDDNQFLLRVIWTDECSFSTNGIFNRHNEHYWAVENPRQHAEVRPQGRTSINIWVGMWCNKIIGPVIYEGSLTSERYIDLVLSKILEEFEDEPLNIVRQLWWQQDGAPPHNGRLVTAKLNEMFPNKWIGKWGTVQWPARSPDLNPLDYFLWGYLKNRLYRATPDNIEQLRLDLIREIRSIPARFIQRSILKLEMLSAKCIEAEGFQFEYLS